jgi:peptidoglycan/LPS O-acetylase OafA/YrhL
VLLVVLFYLGSFTQNELPMQVGLVALVSGALVWLVSQERSVLAGSGLCSRVFLWLGRRSYAMYLVHIPVMFFLRETAFRFEWVLADTILFSGVLAMLLIIILAELNFRWLETPLRLYGRSVAEKLNYGDHPGASSTMVSRK